MNEELFKATNCLHAGQVKRTTTKRDLWNLVNLLEWRIQIKIIPNERKKLLQLADCCCSALFQALKYSDQKHFNYIKEIKNKLYCKGKNLISYGLKLVPSDSEAIELKNLIDFLEK